MDGYPGAPAFVIQRPGRPGDQRPAEALHSPFEQADNLAA